MAEKLKPCPFCGGEALFWTSKGRYKDFAYIQCDTCSAKSKTVVSQFYVDDDEFWDSTACDRLTGAWNRRCSDG